MYIVILTDKGNTTKTTYHTLRTISLTRCCKNLVQGIKDSLEEKK